MAQQIIDIDPTKPLSETIQALKLTSRPLILLLGEVDPALSGQVRSICSRALAPIALDPGALIVDDGSSACAGLIGQAVADQDQMAQLLAVVPHDRPADNIDVNHEFVLRLPSSWSDPIKYMFQIADALTQQGPHPETTLAILFGGATPETKAVIRAAQRGWPVLVLNGTGGLAKSIADGRTPKADGTMPPPPPDPDLREILETANVYLWSLDGTLDELNRVILGRIEARSEVAEATLAEAWHRFDNIDAGALAKQARFRKIELALIVLAVMAALFAILTTANAVPAAWLKHMPNRAIHIVVILVPILISIIAAYNSHFRDGN
jgi:hypothetical protein